MKTQPLKTLCLVALCLWLCLSGFSLVPGAFADQPIPKLTARVTDLTGSLPAAAISSLDNQLARFEQAHGIQVAVLLVASTEPEAIEQYSIRVADAWKLGRKGIDDGVLLLIAKNDRELRIEVGRGLEGVLTDATSNRIIDEIIVPRFKNGEFEGGVRAGVDSILKVVAGEPLPPPSQRQEVDLPPSILFFIIILAVMVIGVLQSLGVLPRRRGLRNGWSSGGFSSGGWGGGGFSGGGGGFSGGGASGRW